MYLLECKVCHIQYVGSASTKFRLRFNNYKNANRKFNLNHSVPQETLHAHFKQADHNGFSDFEFTLIDQAADLRALRCKEAFWQYQLETFNPNGLNEREVNMDFG